MSGAEDPKVVQIIAKGARSQTRSVIATNTLMLNSAESLAYDAVINWWHELIMGVSAKLR